MNKRFKFFGITWVALMIVFNLIVFAVPKNVNLTRLDQPLFWSSYSIVSIAMVIQLIMGYVFCRNNSFDKEFLKIPICQLSYYSIIACVGVGAVFLAIEVLPPWIGAVISGALACLYVVAGLNSTCNNTLIFNMEQSLANTSFIDWAIINVEDTLAQCFNSTISSEVNKVYQALKSSELVSLDALAPLELNIHNHLDNLRKAVIADDLVQTQNLTNQLLMLIKLRNTKHKLLKKIQDKIN